MRRPACGRSGPTSSRGSAAGRCGVRSSSPSSSRSRRRSPGSILISKYDLEAPRLHALYGFSAVIAVGILYSYRTSTFMRGKEYLLYGGGCLFIMGLGLRETLALS